MKKVNKYKLAVALDYNSKEVPKVTTQGHLFTADKIVQIARNYNIPVVEKPSLARTLSQLEENQDIPEHLYKTVAVLLSEIKK
jgi:flagellar biosynthesis protein